MNFIYIPLTVDEIMNILSSSEQNYLHVIHNDMNNKIGYLQNMKNIIIGLVEDAVRESGGGGDKCGCISLPFSNRIYIHRGDFCIPLFSDTNGVFEDESFFDFCSFARKNGFDIKINK